MINIEDILKNIPITNEIILIIVIALILSLLLKKLKIKSMSQSEKNKKGAEYEKKVKKYYESKSYLIDERGLKKGYEDGGIDLVGYGNNEILLIQCKNWNHNNSFKIGEKEVREFYGACNFYIEDKNISDKNIICIYIIPNKELLTNRAISLFKKHYNKCRYEIVS